MAKRTVNVRKSKPFKQNNKTIIRKAHKRKIETRKRQHYEPLKLDETMSEVMEHNMDNPDFIIDSHNIDTYWDELSVKERIELLKSFGYDWEDTFNLKNYSTNKQIDISNILTHDWDYVPNYIKENFANNYEEVNKYHKQRTTNKRVELEPEDDEFDYGDWIKEQHRNKIEQELKQRLKKVKEYGAESYQNYEIHERGNNFELIEKSSIKFHPGTSSTSHTSQKKPKGLGIFTEKEIINFFLNK